MVYVANNTYDPSICAKLPQFFSEGDSITQVCVKHLKISRETYYTWKEKYPEFAAAAKLGEQASEAWWESQGKRAIFSNDGFSSPGYIFTMKSRFRETYGEKKEESPLTPLIASILELANDKQNK